MNIIKTTTVDFSSQQHPDFIIRYDSEIPDIDIKILVSYLESIVATGTSFRDGQFVSFGSMLLRVRPENGNYTLMEPDLHSIPIAWKNEVTQSIKLLRLQNDVAISLGLECEVNPPSIRSSLLVSSDLELECDVFVLERSQEVNSDSGWFIGKGDTNLDYNDANNIHRISVYQAMLKWPHLAGYLALPTGCRVDISLTSESFSRNGQSLKIQEGSFLDIINSEKIR